MQFAHEPLQPVYYAHITDGVRCLFARFSFVRFRLVVICGLIEIAKAIASLYIRVRSEFTSLRPFYVRSLIIFVGYAICRVSFEFLLPHVCECVPACVCVCGRVRPLQYTTLCITD